MKTDEKVLIREATPDDAAGIGRIYAEADTRHAQALPAVFRKIESAARTREYIESVISDENAALFVAELKGRIVGLDPQVAVRENPAVPFVVPLRYAWVSDIAVLGEFHRFGIGRLLMEQVRQWALTKQAKQIRLNVWDFNREALRFYEALGFTIASHMMWQSLGDR